MAPERDTEEQDDTEELFEDFEQPFDEEDMRQYRPSRRNRQKQPIFLWVIGIVVALGLFAFFSHSENKGSNEDPGELKSRIDQLEKAIVGIDRVPQVPDSLEGQIKTLQQSISKLEGSDRSLRERIEGLSRKVDTLAKPSIRQTVEKVTPVEPLVQQKAPPQAQPRFHEVMPGESLFKIAKKYGIPMDNLCRLNNLKENQSITPGQKLVVK